MPLPSLILSVPIFEGSTRLIESPEMSLGWRARPEIIAAMLDDSRVEGRKSISQRGHGTLKKPADQGARGQVVQCCPSASL